MNVALKYPRWQEPLAAAILEFNPQQLLVRAQKAEEAIAIRFKELSSETDNEGLRLLLTQFKLEVPLSCWNQS